MKNVQMLVALIGLLCLESCSSIDETTRKLDKFSPDKKYALLMFDCKRFDISERITDELRRILMDYGFNILDKSLFNELLVKNKLTEQEIINDPTKAMNKIREVDAIIIGKIELEQSSSRGNVMSESGTGNTYTYIKECSTFVFDLSNAEILTNVNYSSAALGNSSSTITPEQVADKIARKLSPH